MTSKWAPHSLGGHWSNVEKVAGDRDVVLARKGEGYTAAVFVDGHAGPYFYADDPVSALEGLEDRLLAELAASIP